MASAGAHLPLWDQNNAEQGKLIYGSELDKLLIQATPKLKELLQLDDVWAHLQTLGVLQRTNVERIKPPSRSRPDQVEELMCFIQKGTHWQYHALMRAMALTGQGHLIPGVDTAVYYPEEDQAAASQLDTFRLSQQLLKDIWDHCSFCRKTLMTSHVFTFEGDPGDDLINTANSFIKVHPKMKDAGSSLREGEMVQMEGRKLLEPLGDSPPPVTIRLYADPGDGKTSFARYSVYSWSIDFLKQVINKSGELCLKSRCPKWTMMIFLTARDIKTTVEAAIQEQLGCRNTDRLMAHIDAGKGVAIFIDAHDECRDPEILQTIDNYVRDCQRKGGPTVIITCRTNLCSIDGAYFDRFVTLPGFSNEQGLQFIQRYTELCQPLLPQPSQAPAVYEYTLLHQPKLEAILCNPLKLYIFAALACRGEIALSAGGEFNIPTLFIPLERYLLGREEIGVTDQQKQDFYRFSLHALLNDIKEFPQSLLQEFNIVKPFHAFLRHSSRRNKTGKLESYFSFGHEMVLEFFASRYISCLNDKERISFLLFICQDRMNRNVQKIVFELLLQEGNAQINLLQTMLRLILIFQCEDSLTLHYKILGEALYDLVQLRPNVPLKNILRSQHDNITIEDAASILERINKTFDTHSDILRDSRWFTGLKDGTLEHLVDCIEACSHDVQQQLIHNTIHRMLPCRGKDEDGDTRWWWYAVGGTRWAEVEVDTDGDVWVRAWCPGDVAEAIVQHAATPGGSDKVVDTLYIVSNSYRDLWGQPGADSCTQQQWHRLLQVLPQGWGRGGMWVVLPDTDPVTDVLSCLPQHAVHLSHCRRISVLNGTAELEDLVTCVHSCTQVGLKVDLWYTHIVVPERLRVQKDKLHQLKDALRGVVDEYLVPRWVTETGEEYVW